MTKYYRARIVLEEVTPLPTDDTATYENTRTSEIAEITVTGGTPGSAMNQIVAHAQELAAVHADRIDIGPPVDPWADVPPPKPGEELPPTALELLDGKKEPKR